MLKSILVAIKNIADVDWWTGSDEENGPNEKCVQKRTDESGEESVRKHFSSFSVKSMQRSDGFSEETAQLMFTTLEITIKDNDWPTITQCDLMKSTASILFLAEKLAIQVHQDWVSSLGHADEKVSDYTTMEAEYENKLLWLIQSLDLQSFHNAVRIDPMHEDSFPANDEYRKWTKRLLEEMCMVVGSMINVDKKQSQNGFMIIAYHSFRLAMALDRKNFGKILASYLKEDWSAEWSQKWPRKPPVSEKIGVALIEKTFKLLSPVLDEMSLHWIERDIVDDMISSVKRVFRYVRQFVTREAETKQEEPIWSEKS